LALGLPICNSSASDGMFGSDHWKGNLPSEAASQTRRAIMMMPMMMFVVLMPHQ